MLPAHGSSDELIALVRRCVIGDDEVLEGPFGPRRVTYADYTASGRALTFVEDFVRDAVLPLYANTHTESSGTGLQTTRFREDARRAVCRAVGGDASDHAVVFCGSGSTAAIDKLVGVLNLRIPADLDARYALTDHIAPQDRPVVFIGPYEHHSNELPWRESICDVVRIPEDPDGRIDLVALEAALVANADRPLRIGAFSAASNVTGIVSDTRAISVLLHRHGALSFWDFAAAAPYVDIGMSPHRPAPDGSTDESPLDYKDAVVLSTHKFIGGPGTPGVLVARRELFTNTVPVVPGGGTVEYVNPEDHVYLSDIEHREEGGTPDIVGSIRAGVVFALKEAIGVEAIRAREESFIHRAIASWEQNPNIDVLGSHDLERLSIVSFVIRPDVPGVGRTYLHHNAVVALLNDLFGIQSRGGCSCAGPYGHRLLGIDLDVSHEFQREIHRGCEGIKPGWVRLNFNYFISEAVFDFLLRAVHAIADDGWRLLPQYRFDPTSGLWTHRSGLVEPPLTLEDLRFTPDGIVYPSHARRTEPESRLADYLALAEKLLDESAAGAAVATPDDRPDVNDDFEHLRWFLLPGEAAAGLAAEAAR